MNYLRQYIRNIILEDKASFLKDIASQEGFDDGFERSVAAARKRGRVAKAIWAKHVDRDFVNSLIYVHYTKGIGPDFVEKYFSKSRNKDEISCEAFLDDKDIKFHGYHGGVGLIIKGYVTLLGNDQDEVYTMGRHHYDAEFPNMKHTSGINKGILEVVPETYVLDREDFIRYVGDRYKANEALLDNWNVQACFAINTDFRKRIKKELRDNNINIPVLDPLMDDLSFFTNE